MLQWLSDRLAELSSWKAAALLVGLFGVNLPAGTAEMAQSTWGLVLQAILAVVALIGFVRKEVK